MTKEIPLTQGKVALVDDADYDWLMQWEWCFHMHPGGGYAVRTKKLLNGKWTTVPMHRVIMNTPSHLKTDHKNHNTLDNQRSNLRHATGSQNARNQIKSSRGRTSEFKGVSIDKRTGRYVAKITFTDPATKIKRTHYLGTFDDQISAANKYDVAARQHFGEFALTNFSDEVNQ